MCQRQTKLEALEKEIAELKKQVCECKEEWPKTRDIYYYITDGQISTSQWYGVYIDKDRRDFLGVFKTKEEAERKLSLIKALCPAKRWIPKKDELYWVSGNDTDFIWEGDEDDGHFLMRGDVHKTKGGADEYTRILKEAYEDVK